MKHFINLKNIPIKDLRKIIKDAKKRKKLRRKLNTLEIDKGAPLKGKLLVQMFEFILGLINYTKWLGNRTPIER